MAPTWLGSSFSRASGRPILGDWPMTSTYPDKMNPCCDGCALELEAQDGEEWV